MSTTDTTRATTFEITLEPELVARLDRLAETTGRSRAELLRLAVETWVAEEIRFVEAALEGIRSIETEGGIPHEQVVAEVRARIGRRSG